MWLELVCLVSILLTVSRMPAAHCLINECGSLGSTGCNSRLLRKRLIISPVTEVDEPLETASSKASRKSFGIRKVILVWSELVSISQYYDVKKTQCIDINSMSILY